MHWGHKALGLRAWERIEGERKIEAVTHKHLFFEKKKKMVNDCNQARACYDIMMEKIGRTDGQTDKMIGRSRSTL